MQNGGTDTSMVYLAAEHGERMLRQWCSTRAHDAPATVPPTTRGAAWTAHFLPFAMLEPAMTRSDQLWPCLLSSLGSRPLMDKTQLHRITCHYPQPYRIQPTNCVPTLITKSGAIQIANPKSLTHNFHQPQMQENSKTDENSSFSIKTQQTSQHQQLSHPT